MLFDFNQNIISYNKKTCKKNFLKNHMELSFFFF